MGTRVMKVLGRCCFGVVLALPLSLAVPEASHAACGSSQRTSHSSAQCLDAGWTNSTRGWLRQKRTSIWAENECASWGKVVAKVDLKSASDKTWHLNNSSRRTGSANAHTRSISCCKDLSHLCNKSDVLTSEGCLAQYLKSPAVKTQRHGCIGVSEMSIRSFQPTARVSGENCIIYTKCGFGISGGPTVPLEYTVHYPDADDVYFCQNTLTTTSC